MRSSRKNSRKYAAKRFLWAAAFVVILPACAQRLEVMRADINNLKSDTYKTQREAVETKASLSALNNEVSAIRKEMQKTAKEDTAEALKESQSSLYMQVQELLNEVRGLKGSMEEERHLRERSLNKASQHDELQAARQAALEKTIKDIEARLIAMEDSLKKLSEAKKEEQAATPPSMPSAERAYDDAFALFAEKKHPEAREKFSAFLKSYPDHRLAGNAQFWLGETYYGQKDYENAILAYEDVIRKYKDSPKLSAAMLKQAMAFIELGDKRAASAILRELIEKHPESEQAPTAKKKLDEIAPNRPGTGDEKPKKK